MISRWLSWLGGADWEVLKHASGDRVKYSTLGGVLLGTAFLAAASATFALLQTVLIDDVDTPGHDGLWPSIVVGVVWGLLILTLDRQLVVTMTRQSGWVRNLVASLPRLLLAVLLGFVISTPLVLQIFDPEIQAQIDRNQAQEVESIVGAEGEPPAEGETPAETDRIDELQDRIAVLEDPSQDADVVRLTEAVAVEQAETDRLSEQVGCEVGTGGQDCDPGVVPGEGPIFRENSRLLGESQARLADLQGQLSTAVATAAENLRLAQENPASELNSARTELTALVTGRGAQLASVERDTGLSARLEALDQIGRASTTILFAHYILIALFAAIEVLPVLSKLLSLSGPPTLYEKLATRREEDVLSHGDEPHRHEREMAEIRHGVRMDLERERAKAQVEAGRRTNEALVETQEEIARSAIDMWSKVVRKQSDAELAAWYEQHRTGSTRSTRRAAGRAAAPPAEEPIYRSPEAEPPPEHRGRPEPRRAEPRTQRAPGPPWQNTDSWDDEDTEIYTADRAAWSGEGTRY